MLMEEYARADFASQEDFEKNFSVAVPDNYNFAFDCVDVLAARRPGKLALLWCNDKGESVRYTFADMAAYSDAAARYFASLGVKKGDAVLLILKRRVQYWFALLGLMKLGALAVPATHLLGAKDIIYRNNAAGIAGIVTTEDEGILADVRQALSISPTVRFCAKVGAATPGFHSFDAGLAAHIRGEKPARVSENGDAMLLYFTSGTTGMPKMVLHSYTYPLCHIATARHWQKLHPQSLHLTLADTGWAKAAWGKIFGQWLCEAAVFVYDHDYFNAGDLLRVMAEHGVTSFCAPPTVYRLLVKMNLAAYDLRALEHACTAGEPMHPEVFEQFRRKTGLAVYEAYGQTEMAPMVFTSRYMTPAPGCIGRPSPAYRLRLLNEAGQEVRLHEEGEICIDTRPGAGLGVFMGYYRDGRKTREAWRGGVYHTGDKVRADEQGRLWFVSRTDDVIKSSGYRIGPFEVESVLMEHPAVLECAVCGVPDALRGQAVKASVILAPGYAESARLQKELQQYVKNNTAAYKCPKIVEFVREFPKTVSGKIRRAELRKHPAPAKAARLASVGVRAH